MGLANEQVEEMGICPNRSDPRNAFAVFSNIEPKITRETLMYLGRRVIAQEMSAPLSGKFADNELFGQRGYKAADSFSILDRSASDQDLTHRSSDG